MDAVVPGSAQAADIAQITVVWAAEMAVQPDGFVIGEDKLEKAIVEAEALAAVAKIADDDLDEDDDDLMDDDEEIAADLPEEMTFGPDDDILPYESDYSSILYLTKRIVHFLRITLLAIDCSILGLCLEAYWV